MESQIDAIAEENRRIRMLRIVSDLLVHELSTRPMNMEDAEKLVSGARSFALKLFPGKEEAFDLIYAPRFRRALREAGLYQNRRAFRVVDTVESTRPTE